MSIGTHAVTFQSVFHGKMGGPNSMKLCTQLTDITRNNIGSPVVRANIDLKTLFYFLIWYV